MKAGFRSRGIESVQPIKYAWIAVLVLIAALIVGMFVPAPRVLASEEGDSDLPFGLQSGLTAAGLDEMGRLPVAKASDLPFSLQSGLVTARGVGYVIPLDLVGGMGLPFGRQSGLVTARGVGFVAQLNLVGGEGLPFGLESGLVTAHLDQDGLAMASGDVGGNSSSDTRGIDASSARYTAMDDYFQRHAVVVDAGSARWSAMGEFYLGRAVAAAEASSARWSAMGEFYLGRAVAAAEASSARWVAMGEFYLGTDVAAIDSARYTAMSDYFQRHAAEVADVSSARYSAMAKFYGMQLAATDISKFYSERSRKGAIGVASLGSALLSGVACDPEEGESKLAENPELISLKLPLGC